MGWKEDLPSEIWSRFNDVNNYNPSLREAIEECIYVIEMIKDGGCDYNNDPDEGRKLINECQKFLQKYTRYVKKSKRK